MSVLLKCGKTKLNTKKLFYKDTKRMYGVKAWLTSCVHMNLMSEIVSDVMRNCGMYVFILYSSRVHKYDCDHSIFWSLFTRAVFHESVIS